MLLTPQAQRLIHATQFRNAAARAEAAHSEKLTLEQAKARSKQGQHASLHRSTSAQCTRWYAKGYYMRSNGLWYGAHGGVEYLKYSTAP